MRKSAHRVLPAVAALVLFVLAFPLAADPKDADSAVALLVGGRFPTARTLALDIHGRTVARGTGTGTVLALSVCPGGRRLVEVVELGRESRLAVRDLPSLRFVRSQHIRPWNQDSFACLDVTGSQVAFFFGSGPDLERHARLVLITPTGTTTVWRGWAWYASFGGRTAYVQLLADAGTAIVAVDTRTGRTNTLGSVPLSGAYQLVLNPAATRLGGDSYDEGRACCPRLLVIDLTQRPISLRTIPLPTEFGSSAWLRNDRFAYFGSSKILVYDPALRLLRSVSGWSAGHPTLVASSLFGLDAGTRNVVVAKLPAGPVRVARRLLGEPKTLVSAIG